MSSCICRCKPCSKLGRSISDHEQHPFFGKTDEFRFLEGRGQQSRSIRQGLEIRVLPKHWQLTKTQRFADLKAVTGHALAQPVERERAHVSPIVIKMTPLRGPIWHERNHSSREGQHTMALSQQRTDVYDVLEDRLRKQDREFTVREGQRRSLIIGLDHGLFELWHTRARAIDADRVKALTREPVQELAAPTAQIQQL